MEQIKEMQGTLYERIYNQIMGCLKSGQFIKNGKLLPESELAELLGVSRTVIRDVLAQLESKGYISRRRGIGTTVNFYVVDLPARIDIQNDVVSFVKSNGYECDVINENVFTRSADAKLSLILQVPLSSEVIVVERTYCANNEPAVYEQDYIARKVIGDIQDYELLKASTHAYFEKYTEYKFDADITKFEPMVSNKFISSQMGTKRNQLIMHSKEKYFDLYQAPVLYSEKHYVSDYFQFNLIRKKG
ncbi:MAG: GntR family transcriptional regulator [Bacilli bacterium]